jgi:aryl-alcohol dehydrogenase-like predicted oxidoreductase
MSLGCFQPLTLGTAQLGMHYGIANVDGQPDPQEAVRILETARAGFGFLDTAAAYGDSESVLGQWLPRVDPGQGFRIVSKIAPGSAVEQWRPELEESLKRLGRSSLFGWLLHHESDFPRLHAGGREVVAEALRAGFIQGFGVSCYTPEMAVAALAIPEVTILQVPASVFDRRFLSEAILAALKRRSGFLFVRSVFLQGVCLMPPDVVPAKVPGGSLAVARLEAFCRRHDLERKNFCLHYLNHLLDGVPHSLIVGAETARQVGEIQLALRTPPPDPDVFSSWEREQPQAAVELVNPLLWKRD